jgi:hypothetical protein
MLRRFASVPFVLAAAFAAGGCGHQVTPSPKTTDLSGHIVVRFQVSGPLDFTNVTYLIAIDACDNGVPYPQAELTGYLSYSYGFFVGGQYGTALPELYQYYANPNSSGSLVKVLVGNLNPSTTQFTPNYANQSNEFQFIFLRSDLYNPIGVAQPCPNFTPGPSASATAGATPSATPTATASASPGTGATPLPSASPQAGVTTWIFNFITLQNGVPADSLGLSGPTDTTYPGQTIDITQQSNNFLTRPPGSYVASNASAAITGGEIDNYP